MKICPVGAESFHADEGRKDRHTYMTKVTVDFRNSATASQNPRIVL